MLEIVIESFVITAYEHNVEITNAVYENSKLLTHLSIFALQPKSFIMNERELSLFKNGIAH